MHRFCLASPSPFVVSKWLVFTKRSINLHTKKQLRMLTIENPKRNRLSHISIRAAGPKGAWQARAAWRWAPLGQSTLPLGAPLS